MDKSDPGKSVKMNAAAVCVFCGSSFGNDPAYREAARAIGSGIAKMGYSLVFGGGGLGLMGEVARAALEGGSEIQGIMPGFLQALEPEVSPQEKLIVTPHLQERKTLMLQMSDAFLVLPGGLGTFDEFFEVATEAQLGVHAKPIIVVNVNGYYDALDTMLHKTIAAGFARETILKLYYLSDGAEAALEILEGALNAPARS
ncbi:MAG TPA: TIGR00730 family Rossman fold protein [Rhizomicrobium sp.]|nr:TIGR00730 family Rossman fold protein [Rhizomicrobium sp.]